MKIHYLQQIMHVCTNVAAVVRSTTGIQTEKLTSAISAYRNLKWSILRVGTLRPTAQASV